MTYYFVLLVTFFTLASLRCAQDLNELSFVKLSKEQAVMLENKFRNTSYEDIKVSESRLIVQYLIDSKTETLESLMKKMNEEVFCGYCVEGLNNFYLGIQGWSQFHSILKRLYTKTNTSLVSPPVVMETHLYDVFFKRPASSSLSSSRESDRSAGYLEKDLNNDKEREPLVKKDKTLKKKD